MKPKVEPELVTAAFEREPSVLLNHLLETSEDIFVKKLSVNDRDWAHRKNKHQSGIYVPPPERDCGFFPPLVVKLRSDPQAHEIREAAFPIDWVAVGETRTARLAHYTSKGTETHLTGLPKSAFAELAPASLLVIGRTCRGSYRALTVDSAETDCELLTDLLDIPPDFVSGRFSLQTVRRIRENKASSFLDEVLTAFFAGKLSDLAAQYSVLPATVDLAAAARKKFLNEHGLLDLNPFVLDRPGDALRQISRGVEYEIFKDLQTKARAIELVKLILGDDPDKVDAHRALRALVLDFHRIDALLLSAAQQRKSRAGYSFEHHIEAMMLDGGIPFEKQVVIEAKKRPDFILPSLSLYLDGQRDQQEALVLSAKTTLRERWKQVGQEIRNCDLYLATVDENIASNAIEDMDSQGIRLVVPESLKNSDTSEYRKQASVISFKTFFETEVACNRWPAWHQRGIVTAPAVAAKRSPRIRK